MMFILATVDPEEEIIQVKTLLERIAEYFDPRTMLMRIVISLIILIVCLVFTKLVTRFFRRLAARSTKFTPMVCSLIRKCTNVLIWIIGAIAVLQTFGINLTPVIAGLGVSGIVLGFALQESISNFFSGFLIAINNPFNIGDYVEIDSIGGTVTSMDLMCVNLTAPDNRKIVMSNKNVWGSVIVNYSSIERRREDFLVSVSYGTDLDKAKRAITEVIASYPEVLPDPAPVIEVHKLSASSIDFVARPWVRPSDFWSVYWRFQKDIVEKFRSEGIDIPFNQLDVNIKKG